MNTKQIDIRFEGTYFFPSVLKKETDWPLNILVESGEISPRGKFKGKPSPYGIALLKIDEDFTKKDPIETIVLYSNKLIKIKKILEKSGVEEIVFDIETSNSKEYNYSLESDFIKKLNFLNARVDFHGNDIEIALDTLINNVYNNSNKYLNREEFIKLEIIRNKIIHTSPNIHVLGASHIYEFLLIYTIKHMGNKETDIPSFENSFLEYTKNK